MKERVRMGNKAPDPDIDQLVKRVERLEARMRHFEQAWRSLYVPAPETPGTDATAPPPTGEEPPQEPVREAPGA